MVWYWQILPTLCGGFVIVIIATLVVALGTQQRFVEVWCSFGSIRAVVIRAGLAFWEWREKWLMCVVAEDDDKGGEEKMSLEECDVYGHPLITCTITQCCVMMKNSD